MVKVITRYIAQHSTDTISPINMQYIDTVNGWMDRQTSGWTDGGTGRGFLVK